MRNKRPVLAIFFAVSTLTLLLAACQQKHVPTSRELPPPPPPATPPAPKATLTAEPSTIEPGDSVTLSWSSKDATELSISPGVGPVQAAGSMSITPSDSTTYTLTAKGPGGKFTATARVTVTGAAPVGSEVSSSELSATEKVFTQNVKDVYFGYDKTDIGPDAKQVLARNADFFKQHPQMVFTIEGHCDERGSEEYNLGLGDRRAIAVKTYLVNLGVSADRINTISYGKSRNVCSEANEDCWQKNRRGHFRYGR